MSRFEFVNGGKFCVRTGLNHTSEEKRVLRPLAELRGVTERPYSGNIACWFFIVCNRDFEK